MSQPALPLSATLRGKVKVGFESEAYVAKSGEGSSAV
jgi:hypothetical protein